MRQEESLCDSIHAACGTDRAACGDGIGTRGLGSPWPGCRHRGPCHLCRAVGSLPLSRLTEPFTYDLTFSVCKLCLDSMKVARPAFGLTHIWSQREAKHMWPQQVGVPPADPPPLTPQEAEPGV